MNCKRKEGKLLKKKKKKEGEREGQKKGKEKEIRALVLLFLEIISPTNTTCITDKSTGDKVGKGAKLL